MISERTETARNIQKKEMDQQKRKIFVKKVEKFVKLFKRNIKQGWKILVVCSIIHKSGHISIKGSTNKYEFDKIDMQKPKRSMKT
jgi:RecG-like helicase